MIKIKKQNEKIEINKKGNKQYKINENWSNELLKT